MTAARVGSTARALVDWRCPVSRAALALNSSDQAAEMLGGPMAPANRVGQAAIGPTPTVAVVRDAGWAYPVMDEIPMLLAPERLFANGAGPAADVTLPPYAQPYAEREAYAALARLDAADINREAARLRRLAALAEAHGPAFPAAGTWIGGGDEIGAQLHAMKHLAPVDGARVLQIGGVGSHLLTMVAAGASRGLLVSPVPAELAWFSAIAERAGLEQRVSAVCAIAEQLPLGDGSVDRVYAPSSLHHTDTKRSFAEIARVLAPGGRFASVDVLRTPLYGAGIRLFGKREHGVACQPMDRDRLKPAETLPGVEVSFHGAVFRYPLAIAARRGRTPKLRTSVRIAAAEDAIARRVPGIKRLSSLVVVTATRPPSPDDQRRAQR